LYFGGISGGNPLNGCLRTGEACSQEHQGSTPKNGAKSQKGRFRWLFISPTRKVP
jgi:hypothetical protein